jgi:hypothetical protein
MQRWIHIDMRIPSEGEEVWYYFGFNNRVYSGRHRSFREEGYPPGVVSNTFYGRSGFLTDDVTFWMPRSASEERPERPSRERRKHEVFHRLEAINGGVDRLIDIMKWCRA